MLLINDRNYTYYYVNFLVSDPAAFYSFSNEQAELSSSTFNEAEFHNYVVLRMNHRN